MWPQIYKIRRLSNFLLSRSADRPLGIDGVVDYIHKHLTGLTCNFVWRPCSL
jgi:hypothetical protein